VKGSLSLEGGEKRIPSPLTGEGQGGGENFHDSQLFHPHPNLPPSRGKEFLWNFVTQD
jgi:hypothetical protein